MGRISAVLPGLITYSLTQGTRKDLTDIWGQQMAPIVIAMPG